MAITAMRDEATMERNIFKRLYKKGKQKLPFLKSCSRLPYTVKA